MKRALISVSDKTQIVEFATGLVQAGYEIISTGGTYDYLQANGVQCIGIETVTGFPEILEGRVKTLHPKIHGGLLAKRGHALHQAQVAENAIDYIDLVCVNLYPFEQTVKSGAEEATIIENIDIGGPSMLRSAAKNFQDVAVVTDVADYDHVLAEVQAGGITLATRRQLAIKVFNLTASYDAAIAAYFNRVDRLVPTNLTLSYTLADTLRYGENPHQKAYHYVQDTHEQYALQDATQLHGKAMSYNNLQDASAALDILAEFDQETVCVAVKHMNPCGVAIGNSVFEAYSRAYEADPISIFGGIVAINGVIDLRTAEAMSQLFLEIILAYDYEPEAFDLLAKKKNLRIYRLDPSGTTHQPQVKSVRGGLLIQDFNEGLIEQIVPVTTAQLTPSQLEDALFGMKVVKHVKSNAIVLVKDGQTLGIGAGQMNRVGSCQIALTQAGDKAQGAVLASDAFFPMRDSIDLAATYGVSAIIQPGGSIKDQDSIDACNEKGVAMVFTGMRHFKH